jgi:hypothetical protein
MTNIDDVYMQSLREDRKNKVMNTEGPFYDAFEGSKHGVLRQELITYKIRDGMLVLERTMRHYNGDDYTDSSSSTPLAEVNNA